MWRASGGFARLHPRPWRSITSRRWDYSPMLMDEILHHLRSPGIMIPLKISTNDGFAWFQSGTGCRASTVWVCLFLNANHQENQHFGCPPKKRRVTRMWNRGPGLDTSIREATTTFPIAHSRRWKAYPGPTAHVPFGGDGRPHQNRRIYWLGAVRPVPDVEFDTHVCPWAYA